MMFGNIKAVTTFALQINTNTYKMNKPTSIRIPKELKDKLKKKAKQNSRSMSNQIIHFLELAVK